MRSVVVTGLGADSPFGRGTDCLWQGALAGRTAIVRSPTGFVARTAGGPNMLAAAREALADAERTPAHLAEAALVLGTTTGGMARWLAGEPASGAFAYHGPAAALARALGCGGPLLVPSAACASGTVAVGLGLELVRSGRVDLALCGGSDELTEFIWRGFESLHAIDLRGPARPFDRNRSGLTPGEGAAFVVLEAESHARRAARARLTGFGSAGDAVHRTGPDREGGGLLRAIQAALADADREPAEILFVSAHGTATQYNDAMEARAFARAGLDHAAVHGLKGAVGHSMGAAGALEAVLCVRALETGLVPPTAGFDEPDPAISLDIVKGEPRRVVPRFALSTSSGFGGLNAAIVLERAGTIAD